MLIAYNGYYDGAHIVMKDNVVLKKGQEVIITVNADDATKEKKLPDIEKYRGLGGKMLDGDAQEFIRELRDNDRI